MTTLESLDSTLQDVSSAVNVGWVIFCAAMVFICQLGYFSLEASTVSQTWIHSIVLKNIEDALLGLLLFSTVGCAFAMGTSFNGIIGFSPKYLFLINADEDDYPFVFLYSFYAIACATIISSCALERVRSTPYLCIVASLTTFQFPLLYHWAWNSDGWLRKLGYIDQSGASIVHITGGVIGLILIFYLGDRQIMPKAGDLKSTHLTMTQQATGTFLLWFGCYGFNCGTFLALSSNSDAVMKTALNTTLISASSGCLSAVLVNNLEVSTIMNGVTIGLVSSTQGVHLLEPWAALIVGIMTATVLVGTDKLNTLYRLDDPLRATVIHIGGGVVGIISLGLFGNKNDITGPGLVYGGGQFLAVQVLFALVVFFVLFIMTSSVC